MALIHSPSIPNIVMPWENPAAPCRDKLQMSYPAIAPFSDAWGEGFGRHNPDFSVWPHMLEGEDGSLRRPQLPNNQYVVVAAAPVAYSGMTWCWWQKVYSWSNTSAQYYTHLMRMMATGVYGGYICGAGYTTDTYSAYFPPRQFFVNQLHVDVPVFFSYVIPTDEWIHVSIIVKFPYGAAPGQSGLYINGGFHSLAVTGDRDAYTPVANERLVGGWDLGSQTGNDFAAKDFREYLGALTASEAEAVYQDSLAFHRATSNLVTPAYIPMEAEVIVVPPTTGHMYAHHHILGAV